MDTPSVEPVLRSRLLPKISFRMMMVATALMAILFAIAKAAGQGATLAIAFQFGVGFLALCCLFHCVAFLIAWAFAMATVSAADDSLRGSPFAENQLPPQILPPRDREL